ncbi:serine hydrolase domain-containing protein [Pontibacter silvestris]|uniref:Serine hydrolase domain-containing protein n=1 Tax=Pontibacter silvestris TaxID=2305183 RepID=A0ABW4WZ45_9BACT|nr:serine hydrolase domain-containing protein [Pontibacter silvestris]MCC9135429.1 beta-lactamase family protein [Pontibacter silvestris]
MLLFFLLGCQADGEALVNPQASLEEGLVSFSFLKADNKDLSADISAAISDSRIIATIPPDISKERLVASFKTRSENSKVYIGSTEQISRFTTNNCSYDIVYKVISEDGQAISYRLELNSAFVEMDEALSTIMQRYNIPALSVAITKNDKLVFSKAYGYANKRTGELASNKSLFRIASLSKPVTSIAILKLVQDRKISLSDNVFGPDGILQNEYPAPPADSKIDLITVADLIAHKSGWTNTPDDPMFGSYSLTAQQIITNQVLHRALEYVPGSTYYYSNLGYCILGRIIEKVSGKTYAGFVKEDILLPAGIYDMQIAGDTEQQQALNEVKYYQKEYSPYSYNMARMDSHGGWIATATDMARFITLIDRNSSKPDLIASGLFENTYFEYGTWSHYGSLPGTTAIITRLNDEFNFIVLANTRDNNSPYLIADELNNTIKAKILLKEEWPETELFENVLIAESHNMITP